jgi:hypothetical protein
MREEMAATQTQAWQRLTPPGTGRTGSQCVAIAAEARHACDCPLQARTAVRSSLGEAALRGRFRMENA